MNIALRLEEAGDYDAVENMIREAFWDVYKPGCNEHLIVHKLRGTPAFVGELSYVACIDGEIVGSIVHSRAKVVSEGNDVYEVLCMGPISVLPDRQNQGIGTLLMHSTIEKARDLGFKGIVIWGNPKYYHRFGYKNAAKFGIRPSKGENCEEFMALELYKDSLSEISGTFYEDPIFETNEAELEEFEKRFPPKEKHITSTQLKI